jgi:hypothetical protein
MGTIWRPRDFVTGSHVHFQMYEVVIIITSALLEAVSKLSVLDSSQLSFLPSSAEYVLLCCCIHPTASQVR